MSAHDVVTFSLAWIAAGALVWVLLDSCGVIKNAIEQRRRRQGRPVTFAFAAVGSAAMILVWPWFVAIAVRRRRQVWIALKRVVWR